MSKPSSLAEVLVGVFFQTSLAVVVAVTAFCAIARTIAPWKTKLPEFARVFEPTWDARLVAGAKEGFVYGCYAGVAIGLVAIVVTLFTRRSEVQS